jgi:hypothetical protein
MAKKSRESASSYTYFKQLFLKNPDWLKEKSNAIILARYRADHGLAEEAEIEKKVMNNLANLKSVLRKQLRKRGRPKGSTAAAPTISKPTTKLEALEISIDDCLTTARFMDPIGLEEVINLLRRARNKVVWKMGEK